MKLNTLIYILFLFSCMHLNAQNKWTWVGGHTVEDAPWNPSRPYPTPLSIYGLSYQLNPNYKPSVREHPAGGVINHSTILMYGGATIDDNWASDMWMFDIPQNQWARVSDKGWGVNYSPVGVESSIGNIGGRNRTASAVDSKGNLWVFGGLYKDRNSGVEMLMNDLWRYNPKNQKWTYFGSSSNSDMPSGRCRARAWFDSNNNIWIYGGAGLSADTYNDLWKYNTQTGVWTFVSGNKNATFNKWTTNGNYPSIPMTSGTQYFPRSRGDYGYWVDKNDCFWIYGGYVESHGTDEYSDLWKFDSRNNTWTLIMGTSAFNVSATTTTPSSRNAPYCWIGNDENLYMYGGLRRWDSFIRDIWRYNIISNSWEQLTQTELNQTSYNIGWGIESSINKIGSSLTTLINVTDGPYTYFFGGYGYGSNADGPGMLGGVWRYSMGNYNSQYKPIAKNDSIVSNQTIPVGINILQNDEIKGKVVPSLIDIDLSLAGVQDSLSLSTGKAKVDSLGIVTFYPNTAYTGTINISYIIYNDKYYFSNPAIAKFSFLPETPSFIYPVAKKDTIVSSFANAITCLVKNNDIPYGVIGNIDIDSTKTGVQNYLQTNSGIFEVNNEYGIVIFRPKSTFSGNATIKYCFQNNSGKLSNWTSISFVVQKLNSRMPRVSNDGISVVNIGKPIVLNVVGNDQLPNSINQFLLDSITTPIQTSLNTSLGLFRFNSANELILEPINSKSGSIVIYYRILDSQNNLSNVGGVLISLTYCSNQNLNVNGVTSEPTQTYMSQQKITLSGNLSTYPSKINIISEKEILFQPGVVITPNSNSSFTAKIQNCQQ